jgi:hypothetical protein
LSPVCRTTRVLLPPLKIEVLSKVRNIGVLGPIAAEEGLLMDTIMDHPVAGLIVTGALRLHLHLPSTTEPLTLHLLMLMTLHLAPLALTLLQNQFPESHIIIHVLSLLIGDPEDILTIDVDAAVPAVVTTTTILAALPDPDSLSI